MKLFFPFLPKRKLTMITGAGASFPYNIPLTKDITALIENKLRQDSTMNLDAMRLFDTIKTELNGYLTNPGIVTFEDIYQSIQDGRVLQDIPHDPRAFDEFRPRVGATHVLDDQIRPFSTDDGQRLQSSYLNCILDVFSYSLSAASDIDNLTAVFRYLQRNYLVWSFTLNYDNLLDNAWSNHETGFSPGSAPRVFAPSLLLSALNSRCHIHA